MNQALFISPGAIGQVGLRSVNRLPQTICRTRRPVPTMAQASEGRASRVVGGPYPGHYGEWSLTQGDVDGVIFYRSSLLASAASCALGVLLAHTPGSSGLALDTLFGVHTIAFGCAIASIHIYLTSMHNLLKVLYASGVAGAIAVLIASGGIVGPGLVNEVLARPALMLAVGWQFVALTGLFFKEAVCFGRAEALALTLLVPVLVGGHFLGVIQGGVADAGMAAFALGYLVFAARKFTQEPRADIGDRSVFDYYAKIDTQ